MRFSNALCKPSENEASSVKGGGHSYTCNSIKEGSMMIDMGNLDGISIETDSDSPTGLVAVLGAGATWGSVSNFYD